MFKKTCSNLRGGRPPIDAGPSVTGPYIFYLFFCLFIEDIDTIIGLINPSTVVKKSHNRNMNDYESGNVTCDGSLNSVFLLIG